MFDLDTFVRQSPYSTPGRLPDLPETSRRDGQPLARLLVRADAGDDSAEGDLWARYQEDDRLHPGDRVVTYSPYGLPPRTIDLQAHISTPARTRS